jgi:hypothetical protein
MTRIDAASGLARRTLYAIAPNHGMQPTCSRRPSAAADTAGYAPRGGQSGEGCDSARSKRTSVKLGKGLVATQWRVL